MKVLVYLSIVLVVLIGSCTTRQPEPTDEINKISMVGNWHRWSTENGYSEFEIDSQYVVVFSEKMGRSKLEYKIENDSFKYLTIDYAAKIIPWGDSMIVLRQGDKVATLIRFNDSSDNFTGIPDDSDTVIFNAYKRRFYQKADEEWEKSGFPKEIGKQ